MDDAALVGVGQPVQHLENDGDLPVEGQGDALAQRLEQVLALEQLHGDVGRAVRVVAEVEDEHHVGVRELGHRPGLPLEAVLLLGVGGELAEHELQGHVAVEERVAGVIDDAHGALAERADDVVLADALGGFARGGPVRRGWRGFAQGSARRDQVGIKGRLAGSVKERGYRSLSISRAALAPGAPVTPPPGWAPAPQR